MRQQKFSGDIKAMLVSLRYANKLPQEVSVRRFLTPSLTLFYRLGLTLVRVNYPCLIDMLSWTEQIQLGE